MGKFKYAVSLWIVVPMIYQPFSFMAPMPMRLVHASTALVTDKVKVEMPEGQPAHMAVKAAETAQNLVDHKNDLTTTKDKSRDRTLPPSVQDYVKNLQAQMGFFYKVTVAVARGSINAMIIPFGDRYTVSIVRKTNIQTMGLFPSNAPNLEKATFDIWMPLVSTAPGSLPKSDVRLITIPNTLKVSYGSYVGDRIDGMMLYMGLKKLTGATENPIALLGRIRVVQATGAGKDARISCTYGGDRYEIYRNASGEVVVVKGYRKVWLPEKNKV
jgi:hypothetical protein